MWAFGTVSRWFEFEVRMNTSTQLDLVTVGQMEANHLLRRYETSVTSTKRDRHLAESGLRNVHLYIPDGNLNKLNSNIPHSSREYVEGGLFFDGAVHEVDLRYRGDNVYHWGYWKKSWRVKTKKGELFEGMRKFNLVAPRTTEMVNNYLAIKMAATLDLITPTVEMVNVTVNGKISGLYILTEQIDESTIRRHDKMPGDVYSGELVGLDAYSGVRNNLFDSSGLWSKVAVNNHFDLDSMAPLDALLSAIQISDTAAGQKRLLELVDIEAFAKLAVYESVAGTVHTDDLHNWRMYYDPWETKFVPLPWDPVGWHSSVRTRPGVPFRPDVISSQLHIALHNNGEFLAAKSRWFQHFFNSRLDETLLAELDSTIASIEPILKLDPNFVEEGKLKSPKEVQASLDTLRSYLEKHLESLEREHVSPDGDLLFDSPSLGTIKLRLNRGRLIEDLRIRFFEPVSSPIHATMSWDELDGRKTKDVSGSVQITADRELIFDITAVANITILKEKGKPILGHNGGIKVLPANFELAITGLPENAEILELRAKIDGYETTGRRPAEWAVSEPMDPIFTRVAAIENLPVEIWEGQITVQGIQTIENPVVIRPGTQFKMEPGANLIFLGMVHAQGTPQEPIEFQPSEQLGPEHAWGTVAIKGEGTNGSIFSSCRFLGGSGLKNDLFEFSSMFSVHGSKNVIVEDCIFEDSYIVDDMVHGVYTDILFRRCLWKRSLSDALDLDISNATIENCWFEDSGNDAIDLMTTKANVVGTIIQNSGDKGISIGEASQLIAIANRIEGCEIGLQSKDDSNAIAINCELLNCAMGVDAYKKNWRYDGGGRIYLVNCKLVDCPSPLSADSHSVVGVDDCYVGGFNFETPKKRILQNQSDSTNSKETADSTYYLFDDEHLSDQLSNASSDWLILIDMNIRGLPSGKQ